ncbi:MAG: ABC transporter ATP-binding protein [Cellulosilyticum sp.]|nr:ABC transporter ATP-binding protein [Cellulosilyticum sp.]
MKPILSANGINKVFNNGENVLKGISLEITPNSFTVLLGPSGCGKTTLLNILSGLLKPSSGKVFWGKQEITSCSPNQLADLKRTHIGNIFQNYLLLNNLTVRENIEIGMAPSSSSLPFNQLTKLLEIDHLLDKFPAQLSGGQQQRVAIARAVIKKPDLLFCDEATGALDEANSKKVVALLQDLKNTFGLTILFVTHNLQIAETADRVITLKDGLIEQDYMNRNPISSYDMKWG